MKSDSLIKKPYHLFDSYVKDNFKIFSCTSWREKVINVYEISKIIIFQTKSLIKADDLTNNEKLKKKISSLQEIY